MANGQGRLSTSCQCRRNPRRSIGPKNRREMMRNSKPPDMCRSAGKGDVLNGKNSPVVCIDTWGRKAGGRVLTVFLLSPATRVEVLSTLMMARPSELT